MRFKQFLESIFDAPGESPQHRMPVSGRIRRKITLPAQITPPHYKDIADKHSHKDRPETTLDFEPTHRSKDIPDLTAQVLSRKNGVVRMLLSYGATGSEPEDMFVKRWEPILSPGLN